MTSISMVYMMFIYNNSMHIQTYTVKMRAGVTVNIILSNRSKDPIYVQIKEQIKQAVLNNTLKPGDSLPSIRQLAKDLQVSVITTKKAYEELEHEGFVESVVGRGSYIAGQTDDWVREQQLKVIDEKLTEAVKESKTIGLSLEEIEEILELIYEGES